ncbi:putative arylsulfatase regulator [Salmonella enterica subsp. enterica]|nr:putative arylsulfatase regulator [Salmonella enterica subsp. enterica] [Salmonella enterica subsp. enterica serovar Menston]
MLHPQRVYAYLKSIGSRYMQFIPLVEKSSK